jgi:hypothetical protein
MVFTAVSSNLVRKYCVNELYAAEFFDVNFSFNFIKIASFCEWWAENNSQLKTFDWKKLQIFFIIKPIYKKKRIM